MVTYLRTSANNLKSWVNLVKGEERIKEAALKKHFKKNDFILRCLRNPYVEFPKNASIALPSKGINI